MYDYEFKTTFWQDFTIADKFGEFAINDTFKRAFEEWQDDYIYLTELVLVLNWKMWEWSEKDTTIARLYQKYWEQADKYALDNLKGEEMTYFYRETD